MNDSPRLEYNLSTLFAENRKIVIPDMQREYCWPNTISPNNGKTLVENFLIGLLENNIDRIRLGLLYGYEGPQDHIQLCDGQQRLTTLYLLVGVVYRKLTGNDPSRQTMRNILISDFELHQDDREPRLQYAIRESTLFFLRDLVYFYFLCSDENIIPEGTEHIRQQNWFFSEYELDPTICNMLTGIDIMTGLLNQHDTGKLERLTNMLTEGISFLLFDMQDRQHGEEQFVVLNTTGKPLTITENIKPVLLGHLINETNDKFAPKTPLQHYSDLWEKWEHFFWINRNKGHHISDNGLNEFFRWVFILEHSASIHPTSSESGKLTDAQQALRQETFNFSSLRDDKNELIDCVEQYFTALEKLSRHSFIRDHYLFKKTPLSQVDCFEFLPVLLFAYLFPDINVQDRALLRVIKFFESRAKIENINRNCITLVFDALELIRILKMHNETDIAQIINFSDDVSITLLSPEEYFKFGAFLKADQTREALEEIVWKAERLKCCKGSIMYLFDVMELDITSETPALDIIRLSELTGILENSLEKPGDLLRRALLCRGDYAISDGYTSTLQAYRYSLGNNPDFFRTIVQNKSDGKSEYVIDLIKHLLDNKETKPQSLYQKLIDDYKPPASPLSVWERARMAMIKDESHLNRMQYKLFSVSDDRVYGLTKQNVSKDNKNSYFIISSDV